MKSKMAWPPGFWPVMKLDQATGDWGGMDDQRLRNPPISASCLKWGSLPRSIIDWTIRASIPSIASTITFFPGSDDREHPKSQRLINIKSG